MSACGNCGGSLRPRCFYCDMSKVERETIARVVAWLRRRAEEREGSAGALWHLDVARRLESGAWKEDGDHG